MAPAAEDSLTEYSSKIPESFFQYLHKNFISLQDDERKVYVEHFMKVLKSFTLLMKENDKLFAAVFQRVCGAGSYFDGLRVSKATEFDMDIVMKLPFNYKDLVIDNEGVPPAFTKVKVQKALDNLRQNPNWSSTYKTIDNWCANGYLLQTKFRTWMESVVAKALNVLPKIERNGKEVRVLNVQDDENSTSKSQYLISNSKSGPAITLNIYIPNLGLVDVDLVPVIEFVYPQWPTKFVRSLPTPKRTSWFIVPKEKKSGSKTNTDIIWRLAFHDQERELISGKLNLKPVCRLMKKFRDVSKFHFVASYYIKTMFLWEIEKQPEKFWQNNQSFLFLYMLNKFCEYLNNKKIPYYWDKRYNLLEGMTEAHFINYNGRLGNICKTIKKGLSEYNDGCTCLAEYLLDASELEKWKLEFKIAAPSRSASMLSIVSVVNEVNDAPQPSSNKKSPPPSSDNKVKPQVGIEDLNKRVEQLERMVHFLLQENASLKEELILQKRRINCLYV